MPLIDKKVWSFPGKVGLTLQGHSRAAEATFFRVPELNWCLDAGIETNAYSSCVFLTHGHMDHAQSLPCLNNRRAHTAYYAPAGVANFAKNYIYSAHQMNDCTDAPYPRDYSVLPVSPNVKYDVSTGKKNYIMRVIDCIHPVPCVGYCFWEPRNKLKEEYKDLDGKKIGELRKSGVEVSEAVEQPMFVFMGDTTAKVFDINPQLFKFPVILIECTNLEEDTPGEAAEKGHTSWNDLKPYVLANPQTTFVIIHFSPRYSNEQIDAHFKKENLPNVVPWCDV